MGVTFTCETKWTVAGTAAFSACHHQPSEAGDHFWRTVRSASILFFEENFPHAVTWWDDYCELGCHLLPSSKGTGAQIGRHVLIKKWQYWGYCKNSHPGNLKQGRVSLLSTALLSFVPIMHNNASEIMPNLRSVWAWNGSVIVRDTWTSDHWQKPRCSGLWRVSGWRMSVHCCKPLICELPMP